MYSLVLMNFIKVFAAYDSSVWSMWSHLCLDENFYFFPFIYLFTAGPCWDILKKFFFDQRMADLQCVCFRCIAKWIYYTYLQFFKDSFSVPMNIGVHVSFYINLHLNKYLNNLSFRKEFLFLAFRIFRSKDQLWMCLLQETCGALGPCFGSFGPFIYF